MGKDTKGVLSWARVFVYGTLKRNYKNHKILQMAGGRLVSDEAICPKAFMVNLGGFPGAIKTEDEKSKIYGQIWDVVDLKVLDRLEGHPSFYCREKWDCMAFIPNVYTHEPHGDRHIQDFRCWVYFLPEQPYARSCDRIKHGVWVEHTMLSHSKGNPVVL